MYGWSDEACTSAAAADERIRQLLDVEMTDDIPEKARQIREQMTRFETCDQSCLQNVERRVEMIANQRSSTGLGWGETDPGLSGQLRLTMAPLAK